MTKEEVLSSTFLMSILPVLSLEAVENLATDLERAVKNLGPRHDKNGLRQVAVAVRAFYVDVKNKDERLEAELTIG